MNGKGSYLRQVGTNVGGNETAEKTVLDWSEDRNARSLGGKDV